MRHLEPNAPAVLDSPIMAGQPPHFSFSTIYIFKDRKLRQDNTLHLFFIIIDRARSSSSSITCAGPTTFEIASLLSYPFSAQREGCFQPMSWGKGCLQWSSGKWGEKESRAVQYGEGSSSRYPTRFASSLIRCANYGFVFFLFGIALVFYAMRYDTTMQCIMVILRVSCHYLSFITCHHHLNGPCYYYAENHLRLLFLCESYKAIFFKISWEVTGRSTLRMPFWILHIYL
ncbi:hypothetical protein FOWG_09729 [Fusarium oxysporum f. sp. lycopersici MN25]|nr:hypothetical protein FOWG_09729 [Fusarium oxysporum f. sp. lycopersici MN25]